MTLWILIFLKNTWDNLNFLQPCQIYPLDFDRCQEKLEESEIFPPPAPLPLFPLHLRATEPRRLFRSNLEPSREKTLNSHKVKTNQDTTYHNKRGQLLQRPFDIFLLMQQSLVKDQLMIQPPD